MTNKQKEQIKVLMNYNEFMVDRRYPTDKDWDEYFIKNYNGNYSIQMIGDSFITYEIRCDHIFIKDFVSYGNGIELFNNVKDIQNKYKLPIRAHVHFSNEKLINVMKRRFGFKVIGVIGKQWIMEYGK